MNKGSKYAIGIASLFAVGTFAVGGASAAGSSTTTPHHGKVALTTAEKCAKQDEVAAKVAHAHERIAHRKEVLQKRRAEAVAKGQTERVAHIDQRLTRLDRLDQRITTRYGKYQTWVAANCNVG
jgi:hypothetical protein